MKMNFAERTACLLYTSAVRSHLLQGLGVLGEILVVVHGAQRIADAALHMRLFLNGGFDGRLQVARVVQRVENTQDVNAVGNGLLHEILDGVVRVMAVACLLYTSFHPDSAYR